MARSNRDRIREWLERSFLPTGQARIYECADVTELLPAGWPTLGLVNREGMLFAARDKDFPCPRREVVVLNSALASYSGENLTALLDRQVLQSLIARPHLRQLVDDELMIWDWGLSSTGIGKWEWDPCHTPQSCELA